MTLGINKRSVLTALHTQFFDIDLALLDLGREAEAITFNQHFSVLEDHRIATIDHILRGFTKTTAGIDISANGTGTLLS